MKLKLGSMRRSKPTPVVTGRYRVALQGFSDFERSALVFCFKHAAKREPTYVHVERAAQADVIVADASHDALATSVTRRARLRDTLFVGDHAPDGARARVGRPIDPEEILRALDELIAGRDAQPSGEPPDIVLPLAPGVEDFPTLSESDIVETTPAAFEHAPVLINLADLEPIVRPRARGPAQPPPAAPPPPAAGSLTTPAPPPPREADAATPEQAPDAVEKPALEPKHEAPAPRPRAGSADDIAPQRAKPAGEGAVTQAAAKASETASSVSIGQGAGRTAEATTDASATIDTAQRTAQSAPSMTSPTAADRAEAKAAARRRSRLARLAQSGRDATQVLRDVVLLDPHREHADLGAQLGAFGFEVHAARFSADAISLLAEIPLAAVFLDVASGSDEDLDGLELCMEIKHRTVELAGAVPPVFLLANRDSAAGRVRAKLAGCDALLIHPVTRGDAARALEACDVALPADERRLPRS